MTNVQRLSDKELLEILVRNENTDIPGSLFQKAATEYSIRRLKKDEEHQKALLHTTEQGLNKIIKLLEFISNKPITAILYAGMGAIVIGVAINIFTEIGLRLLRLK